MLRSAYCLHRPVSFTRLMNPSVTEDGVGITDSAPDRVRTCDLGLERPPLFRTLIG